MYTLRAHKASVTSVAFHPNGTWLFSGDEAGWIVWWNLESRRPLAIWKAHEMALLAVKYLANPEVEGIVTHGRDNKLRIWKCDLDQMYNTEVLAESTTSDAYPAPWLVHSQDVNALNFCKCAIWADPPMVAVPATTSSEKVDVYTVKPFGRPIKGLVPTLETDLDDSEKRGNGLGTVMAIDLSDRELVIGYESGHIAYYRDSDLVFLQKTHKQPVLDIKLRGGAIWSSGADRSLCCILNGKTVTQKMPTRGIASLALDQDATKVITAGWDGMVRGFSPDLQELWSFKGGRQNGVTCVDYASVQTSETTGRRLVKLPPEWIAVGGKDGRIGLFPLETQLLKSLVH